MRNEWVIHVWGKEREGLVLTDVEKFHLDMLSRYQEQQKRFDRILVNIAMDNVKDKKLYNFMKREIGKSINSGNVEFRSCENDPIKGEYVTFRPYVFDRIGEDVNIFYTHFKGYHSYVTSNRESFPNRVIEICEMFWSYMMYEYSMDFDDVQEKLKDKVAYCWFMLKSNKIIEDYFYRYQKILFYRKPDLKSLYTDGLRKHSPGSFAWYNMKNLEKSLLCGKMEVANVTDDILNGDVETSLYTHFCELYLMQFLDEKDIYSVNDFNEEWMKIRKSVYLSIYPMKTIGKDIVGDFEKYLFDKGLM